MKKPTLLCLTLLTLVAAPVRAATIFTSWNTGVNGASAAGTIVLPSGSTANVTYTGNVYAFATASGGFNLANYSTYASPTAGFVMTDGGNTAPQNLSTISFSAPINSPLFYINSLGNGTVGITIDWTFNQPFTIVAGTTDNGFYKKITNPTGNVIRGTEGYGVIQFSGPVSSISWTSSAFENTTAFTLAYQTVPEVSSGLLTLLTGSLACMRRRRA